MTFESNGIYVSATSGQEKTKCPKCSHRRRKSSDPCLSVSIDEGVWNCHHCGWSGSLNKKPKTIERKKKVKYVYESSTTESEEEDSDPYAHLDWRTRARLRGF